MDSIFRLTTHDLDRNGHYNSRNASAQTCMVAEHVHINNKMCHTISKHNFMEI